MQQKAQPMTRRRSMMFCLMGLWPALLWPGAAAATADAGALCDAAARRASAETGVPLSVLSAITLTETGKRRDGRLRPWPWTVTMEGEGRWFDGRAAARHFAETRHGLGARSFDIGCFQLNYRWHGEHFASIDAMFDPLTNARYAAGFLARLYREMGDWSVAAGAYHSRTPRHAARYRARFDDHRRALIAADPGAETRAAPLRLAAAPPRPAPRAGVVTERRANAYPLLRQTEGRRALGSLVPLGG